MVSDAEAIRRLLYAYAERLDGGDFDGVAALFDRATFGSAGRRQALAGAEQVRRVYEPVIVYDGLPRTKHVIAGVAIEFDGPEAARSRCAFTVFQATGGLRLQPILAGRYHDRFARFTDGWWFVERVVHPDLRGELGWHMSGER